MPTAGIGSYYQLRILPMVDKCRHLTAMVHELHNNYEIIVNHYVKLPDRIGLSILPQFRLVCASYCIGRGVLDPKKDRKLFNKLHQFYNEACVFNPRLLHEESAQIHRKMEERFNAYKGTITSPRMENLRK